ncbi:CAP domain-containing protein [Kribbella solani]|uniref:CAP domain-containing protein n=1 Tax=Kribbella solani TaxID=236067 RepID=UPI0029AB02C2|nr:CAP domain-containing protein [Kribbella solani]MDX2967592.1 CAP domain-containing protein [Kribbella solani]MDX3002524.1 CAP domain-containing protein [Kribbella solani]
MTDSPTPRRHRGSRRAPRRSRGLIGPIVSALSVLLAIGPVVWLMSRDTSHTNDATTVLNVAENSRVDGGSSEGTSGTPLITITKTLPDGRTTTAVIGTPALGTGTTSISTSTTPATTGTPSDSPSSPLVTPTASTVPTVGVTTVTVPPTPGRTDHGAGKPRPTRSTSSTPRDTPTKTKTTEPKPSDTPEPPPSGGGTNAQERQVLDYTNRIREQQGCGPLRLDSALVEAAGRHASDMVRRHYMDHKNPDGEGPGDRMAAAGYRGSGWGENIAAGYDSAQKVVTAWMKSDGHRKNILNCRFTSIGVGYDPGQVKPDWGPGSWVQDFGRS